MRNEGESRIFSRREFLQMSGIVATGAVSAACSGDIPVESRYNPVAVACRTIVKGFVYFYSDKKPELTVNGNMSTVTIPAGSTCTISPGVDSIKAKVYGCEAGALPETTISTPETIVIACENK